MPKDERLRRQNLNTRTTRWHSFNARREQCMRYELGKSALKIERNDYRR